MSSQMYIKMGVNNDRNLSTIPTCKSSTIEITPIGRGRVQNTERRKFSYNCYR